MLEFRVKAATPCHFPRRLTRVGGGKACSLNRFMTGRSNVEMDIVDLQETSCHEAPRFGTQNSDSCSPCRTELVERNLLPQASSRARLEGVTRGGMIGMIEREMKEDSPECLLPANSRSWARSQRGTGRGESPPGLPGLG